MSKKRQNEVRMTLYRLVGLPSLHDAIRNKYLSAPSFDNKALHIEDHSAFLVTGMTEAKDVRWRSTLESLSGQPMQLQNSTAAAALIIRNAAETKDSGPSREITAWALTFGMGFQMLEQKYIDNGFGQRIAIRTADPAGINSINKTTLDDRPRIVRSTIASGGPLRSFGFEDLGDLATRIVTEGRVPGIGSDDRPVKIKGADSLSMPLSLNQKDLLGDLHKINATLELEPASEELKVLEQLAIVKDKTTIDELDNVLVNAIGKENHPLLTLSFPHELIDEYGNASGYRLTGAGDRSLRDHMPTQEILLSPLRDVPVEQRKQKLDRISVQLFAESDGNPISPNMKARKWLAFQADFNGLTYHLHNGKWFSMDRNYATVVKKRTKAIFNRGPLLEELPEWDIVRLPNDKAEQKRLNSEEKYNHLLADKLGGLCLDRKLVRSELHVKGIEACDVLLKDGTFIHVKHISSSAPASHLLAQALVSTEVLTYDKKAQDHLKHYIQEAGGDPEEYQVKPRTVLIVLAKDEVVIGPEDLFTFTQVNLARQVAQLDEQQISVHIAPVARRLRTDSL